MAGVDVSLGQLRDYFKGIYDAIATGGAAKKNTGLQIAGTDGTNAQIIRTNANGEALVQLSGSIVATKGVRRVGNLANGVSEIFLERNKETIIHNLIVSYSIGHWQFRMLPYWWDGGTWINFESIGKLGANIPANGYVVYPGMLTDAVFNEMLWEVISNTDTAKVVRLKNTPLRVRGVKLVLENIMPSDDANMAAVCFYSEVN